MKRDLSFVSSEDTRRSMMKNLIKLNSDGYRCLYITEYADNLIFKVTEPDNKGLKVIATINTDFQNLDDDYQMVCYDFGLPFGVDEDSIPDYVENAINDNEYELSIAFNEFLGVVSPETINDETKFDIMEDMIEVMINHGVLVYRPSIIDGVYTDYPYEEVAYEEV